MQLSLNDIELNDIEEYKLYLQYVRYEVLKRATTYEQLELKKQYKISEEVSIDRALEEKNNKRNIISTRIIKLNFNFANKERIIEYTQSQKSIEETDNGIEETDNGIEETDNGIEETDNGIEETDNGIEETDNGIEETYNGIKNIILDKIIKNIKDGQSGKGKLILEKDKGIFFNQYLREKSTKKYIAVFSELINYANIEEVKIVNNHGTQLENNKRKIEELKTEIEAIIKTSLDYDIDINQFLLLYQELPSYLVLLGTHKRIIELYSAAYVKQQHFPVATKFLEKTRQFIGKGAEVVKKAGSKIECTALSSSKQNRNIGTINKNKVLLDYREEFFINKLGDQLFLFDELKLIIPKENLNLISEGEEQVKQVKRLGELLATHTRETEHLQECTKDKINELNSLEASNTELQCIIKKYHQLQEEWRGRERRIGYEINQIEEDLSNKGFVKGLRVFIDGDSVPSATEEPSQPTTQEGDNAIQQIDVDLQSSHQVATATPATKGSSVQETEESSLNLKNLKIILIMALSIFISLPLLIIAIVKKTKQSKQYNEQNKNNKFIDNIINNAFQVFLLSMMLYMCLSLLINNNAFKFITLDKLLPTIKSETDQKIIITILSLVFLILFSVICNLVTDLIITELPKEEITEAKTTTQSAHHHI